MMHTCAYTQRWPLSQFPVPFLYHVGRPSHGCVNPCGLICLPALDIWAAVGQRTKIRMEKTWASSQAGLGLNSTSAIFPGKAAQILGWGWGLRGYSQNHAVSACFRVVEGTCQGQSSTEQRVSLPRHGEWATAGSWQPSAPGNPISEAQVRLRWLLFPQFSPTHRCKTHF